MTCIFPFFHIFSTQKEKSKPLEQQENGNGIRVLSPVAQRATASRQAAETTSISERKAISLGSFFRRLWISLKYRDELKRAASDCKKLLASLVSCKPYFALNNATSLCVELKNFPRNDAPCFDEKEEFNALYREVINRNIEKYTVEFRKKHPEKFHTSIEDIRFTINRFFIPKPKEANQTTATRERTTFALTQNCTYYNAASISLCFYTFFKKIETDPAAKAEWDGGLHYKKT